MKLKYCTGMCDDVFVLPTSMYCAVARVCWCVFICVVLEQACIACMCMSVHTHIITTAAHSCTRDLKPENYLFRHAVVDDGQPLRAEDLRAIDFGLSLFLESGERRREMAGSSYYMAPEVIQRNYSFAADMWSVGVITYILVRVMHGGV